MSKEGKKFLESKGIHPDEVVVQIDGYRSFPLHKLLQEYANYINETQGAILKSDKDKETFFNALMNNDIKPNKHLVFSNQSKMELTTDQIRMTDLQKETAEKYQDFFNFIYQIPDMILTIEQMAEMVFKSKKLVGKFCESFINGRSEQLSPNNKPKIVGDFDNNHNDSFRNIEQLYCDVCGSNDIIESPHMGRNCNRCNPL